MMRAWRISVVLSAAVLCGACSDNRTVEQYEQVRDAAQKVDARSDGIVQESLHPGSTSSQTDDAD